MKKTFIFGLMAAALGFTACSSDDDLIVNNDNNQKKGMVLRATVEQPAETRATISDTWQFAFATSDKVSVTNTAITGTYTFTNDGTQFKSEDAQATGTDVTWYAYFPSNTIDLTGQSGERAAVANKYALAGATASPTTGKEGLNITMSPKVAILVIDNQKGSIDINVKNSSSTWVSGLAANEDGFTVSTADTKQSLLSETTTGTYYVAVPAGVQLAVKDGDKTIKSTTNGLKAGCYYNLTIVPATTGEAEITDGTKVKWVQLWENGPKFAEFNVGAKSATDYGGYYTWGGTYKNGTNITWTDDHNTGSSDLSGDSDTATKLWGSKWRMPTSVELEALINSTNCTVEWIDGTNKKYNNTAVEGLLCTGKGAYASNSVFLPAAGGCYLDGVLGQGSFGYYWSSTPDGSSRAYGLSFDSGYQEVYGNDRDYGFSVRAVLNETEAPAPTKGTAKATINSVETDIKWIQLWENGPKFAEFNVGAKSATDYGGYYAWGGTYQNGTNITWTDDHNTGSSDLSGDSDTATKLWGSKWRMPTKDELGGLLNNCNVAWTDDYKKDGTNIKGSIFTGRGDYYSSNSIFLPAAGFCGYGDVLNQGHEGFYWSSTTYDSYVACRLGFNSSIQNVEDDYRGFGYSVRAVLAE